MQTSTKSLLTYLTLIFTMLFWGGTFIAGRMLATELAPANSAFIRFAIATVALFFLTIYSDGRLSLPTKSKWLPLILLGLTGVFGYNIFFFNGLQHINAGRASLIIALNPLVISLFATLFLGEKLNLKQFGGILLSLIGAAVVISNGNAREIWSSSFGTGELAIFGCVASWSIYSLIGRSVLTELTPLASVFYSSLIGTIFLGIPALQHNIFSAAAHLNLISWSSLFYLGFFGTALGFSMYYRAIKEIGATRSGIFINLVPLFAILLSWFILGETIRPLVVFGGLILLCGVSVTNLCRD